LLPPIDALGPVLAQDALSLRPYRDGTRSVYRGRRVTDVPSTTYTNVVSQTVNGTTLREAESNAFGAGALSGAAISIGNGAVTNTEILGFFDGGPTETINVVELRSPVRVNDRHVALDKRIDARADFDGDQKSDQLDVAVFTQVIGEEILQLLHRRDVHAVRVDTTVRIRARFSFDGSVSAVSEAVLSRWYSPELGVVRSRAQSPYAHAPNVQEIIDEVLVSIDRGDSGFGATEAVVQVGPAGSAIAGQPIPIPYQAVSFDSHVVALSTVPQQPSGVGFALHQIDARGTVVASSVYMFADFSSVPSGLATDVRMLRTGEQLKVFFRSNAGLQMLSLDATGQSLLQTEPALISAEAHYAAADGTSYVPAYSADGTVWLTWVTYPEFVGGNNLSRIKLARYTNSGGPIGIPVDVVTGIQPLSIGALQMASGTSQAALYWSQLVAEDQIDHQYVIADGGAGTVTATIPLQIANSSLCAARHQIGWVEGRVAFSCDGAASVGWIGTQSDLTPELDINGLALVSPLLAPDWPHTQGGLVLVAHGNPTYVVDSIQGRLWPDDSLDTTLQRFSATPLASNRPEAASQRLFASVPMSDLAVRRLFPIGNGLVVIGDKGNLATLVVWQ
jgi:hypothetical protein